MAALDERRTGTLSDEPEIDGHMVGETFIYDNPPRPMGGAVIGDATDLGEPFKRLECRHCAHQWTGFAEDTCPRCIAAFEQSAAKTNGHGVDWNGLKPADWAVTEEDAEFIELMESWTFGDVAHTIANGLVVPQPELLMFADGRGGLFYRGKVNGLHGDSGIGKSWSFLLAAAQQIKTQCHVLICDYESSLAEVILRLRSLGVTDDEMVAYLHHVSPQAEAADAIIEMLLARCREWDVTLVGIDSIGEAFGLEGIDENKDVEVGPWLRRVARRLADAGPAVVIVDHGTKAADNPLHPSGSKRKRAAITGASFLVTTTQPPTREASGKLLLTCAKDRHGTYARGKLAATLTIESYPDGGVMATLHQPSEADEARADIGVLLCARDAVRAAKKEAQPLSMRSIVGLMKTKAGTDLKRAGVELAVARGCLAVEKGPRNATLHVYASDFDINHGEDE